MSRYSFNSASLTCQSANRKTALMIRDVEGNLLRRASVNGALREKMREILEYLAEDAGRTWYRQEGSLQVERNALLVLRRAGHITSKYSDPLLAEAITLSGYEYLETLQHPFRVRIREHWFPTVVAISAVVSAIGSNLWRL